MSDAADAMEAVGSLDQAMREKTKRVKEQQAEVAELDEQIKDAKDVLSMIKQAAETEGDFSRQTSQDLIAAAEKCAESIKRAGKSTAASIETDANNKAKDIIGKAMAQSADVGKEVITARATLKEITERIHDSKIEAERITSSVTAARATLAKMMG
jgi:cell division septum initiation protein DivIVA